MKTILGLLALVTILFVLPVKAQTAPAAGGVSSAFNNVVGFFNLGGTNGIAQAYQLDTGFGYTYSQTEKSGGVAKVGYWLTPQQGADLEYDEFADRKAFWDIGYQTRTVFGSTNSIAHIEPVVKIGMTQAAADALGDVRLSVEPSFRYQFGSTDAGLVLGCKITQGSRPDVFVVFNYRFK